MRIFMDNTQWGEKKAARLYFKITRGKYKDQTTSFKGTFLQDRETQAWVVGSESKLADVIRAITGGKTLSNDHTGTRVFVVIKQKVSKKTKEPYSFVESCISRPEDDGGTTLDQAAEDVQRPAAAQPKRPAPTPVTTVPQKPTPKPVIPASVEDAGEGLLADLTELSDFKE